MAFLDVREEMLFGLAEISAQISLSDFAGLAKVLVIGIDFRRLLKRSEALLLASHFLCRFVRG
jgi:hypothetical protein